MLNDLKLKITNWKYLEVFVLVILFAISFLLRAYQIDKNLFFGPEQGRDLLVVKSIVLEHKFVLIGPKTAVEGVFHGPLYYYLATIPFLLSKGDPLIIEYFFIFLNCLSVFFVYFLAKELFNKRIALVSVALFTFSYGSIVMSRWLSHPPLITPISCLFFLALVRFLKGKSLYLIPVAIFFALASQIEFTDFLIFSWILLIVIICFWKRFLSQKWVFLAICIIILLFGSFANFLLFDLRHNFLITSSFINLLTKHAGFYGTFKNSILGLIQYFTYFYYDLITPFYPLLAWVAFILGLVSLTKVDKKYKVGILLLLIWITSPFIAFISLKYSPMYHYFASVSIALIILMAILIDRLWNAKRVFGVVLAISLMLLNLFAWFQYLPSNKDVFFQSTQPDLKYSDQEFVIKKIFKMANGKPFSIQAYTIPYWLQEGWLYLFWYYGQTYGYVPTEHQKMLYVIIQNDPNTKLYQNIWLKDTVSKWGVKEDEFRIGALTVWRLKVL